MPSAQRTIMVSGLGVSISNSATRIADGGGSVEIAVPAGNVGQLTTRTDNETGTLTMASADHTITTAAVIDLYWEGGSRIGITVGTVAGTSVPIGADDSGIGDNLPTNLTNVVASVQVPFNVAIDGDEMVLLAMQMFYADATATGESVFLATDESVTLGDPIALEVNIPRLYDIAGGDANPFAGLDPVASATISNAATVAGTLKMMWVVDATP